MRLLDRSIDGHHLSAAPTSSVPPERRGLDRDAVRLMVAGLRSGTIGHHRFRDLPRLLMPGDVLVVNTSATVPAAVDVITEDGVPLKAHFASPIAGDLWWLELRTPNGDGSTTPGPDLASQTLTMPGGGSARLVAIDASSPRLWVARLGGIPDLGSYLQIHGAPIRYLPGDSLPITEYQTVFANEPGSAEMPSAGRPFTSELVTRLVSAGVVILPILLHTGVSSYEEDERPGVERYRVPATTAQAANQLRAAGGRIVAVGTTVVRALETVARWDGTIHPGEGQTDLVIARDHRMRVVDGLITGWHEPSSSHLRLLEALAGPRFLGRVYEAAADAGYLWHEFGDSLLVLP
jgi:S-adenosylmethionine:tRNA ribosyltransferase-isomerase